MKIRSTSISLLNCKLSSAAGGSGVTEVDVIVCDIVAQDSLDGLGFSYAIGGRGAPAAQAAGVGQFSSAWPQLISRFGIFMPSAWIYR